MLLAFGHKARHGKDSAGEAVVEFYNNQRQGAIKHGYYLPTRHLEARIFKFADELYRVCREEYGMTVKDPSLLQKIGDGRRNEFGETYWIDKLAEKINAFNGIAVITDVRYTNEADWIKKQGGHTINVSRLNQDGTPFVTTDRDPHFISEVQLDNYNYDHYIKTKSAAETGEIAITIAEFIRSLESIK